MYDQLFVYNEQNKSNFSDSSKRLLRNTERKNEKKLIE